MTTSGDRQALAADGNTTYVKTVGPVRVSISGDLGGGTAKVQAKDPAGNAVDRLTPIADGINPGNSR